MAAPANTPEDLDLLSSADARAVANCSEGSSANADEEHAAAVTIQAARRGKAARRDVAKMGSPDRSLSSNNFTPELAKSHAHALAPTADGSWALTQLSASGLRLAGSLSNGLAALPHLTAIDLSDNRLLTLEGLEALPRLSSLVCCGNRLQGVLDFPAPAGGSCLRVADLRHNRIAGAVSLPTDSRGRPVGVDAHSTLEVLKLDGNQLRSLRGIDAVPHLMTFTASANELQDTAGAGGLVHLETLDLSSNGLATCAELADLCRLQALDLHSNRLTSLPDLSTLIALHRLDVASNSLASLEAVTKAVGGAVSPLRTLSLHDNPLEQGRPDLRLELLYQLPHLATLDGTVCTAEERVFSRNMHGDDNSQLRATRREHGFKDSLNTAEANVLPNLLHLYRAQYTKAFKDGVAPLPDYMPTS